MGEENDDAIRTGLGLEVRLFGLLELRKRPKKEWPMMFSDRGRSFEFVLLLLLLLLYIHSAQCSALPSHFLPSRPTQHPTLFSSRNLAMTPPSRPAREKKAPTNELNSREFQCRQKAQKCAEFQCTQQEEMQLPPGIVSHWSARPALQALLGLSKPNPSQPLTSSAMERSWGNNTASLKVCAGPWS